MKTRSQIYLCTTTGLTFVLLASLMNFEVTKFILILLVLNIIVIIIVETIFRIKESKYIKLKRDIDPRKIKVSNDGYDEIEGCFAKINKLYVLGKNHTCQKIADNNWDYVFQWDDGTSKYVKIPNGSHNIIDIFDADDKEIVLLFQNNLRLPLPKYKDIKNGENACRGKYQLELVLFGNGKTNGGKDSIKRKSRWEIYYHSMGAGKLPTFKMQQIKKMAKPTGKILDDQAPNITSVFNLYLKR